MSFNSSSVLISICRTSRNFFNVVNVMTWLLLKSTPAQFVRILAVQISSKIRFCVYLDSVISMSRELLRVRRPIFRLPWRKWHSSGALRLFSLANTILAFRVTDNWSNMSRKSFRAQILKKNKQQDEKKTHSIDIYFTHACQSHHRISGARKS